MLGFDSLKCHGDPSGVQYSTHETMLLTLVTFEGLIEVCPESPANRGKVLPILMQKLNDRTE